MFEARAISLSEWQIFDLKNGEFLLEVYPNEIEATVAAEHLSAGVMVPTRASYTRGAWARIKNQWQGQQMRHSVSPEKIADEANKFVRERAIWNAILTEAVPWLA
jgi:hypothetical protein